MRILILGGYGVFGGRLARLLADRADAELILAGRSLAKAQALAGALTNAKGAAVDRDSDVTAALADLKPDLVVDASGPWQGYGAAPYGLVEACIAAGVSYLDLADSTAFVEGIAQFDSAAKAAGVTVISGLSTCPVLTAAAVREASAGMSRVTAITAGIGPSPYSGVGLNVIKALTSYAGCKVSHGEGRAFLEARRVVVAPPGHTPLAKRLFALVDTPDSAILQKLWPGAKVWFGAGPVPEFWLRMLILFAWLHRWRLMPRVDLFAPIAHWVINTLGWGEHRGGMFVTVDGEGAEGPLTRTWHLVAEGDDGPYIPAMPAAALIRRWLDGAPPPPGARDGTGDLGMADYQTIFATKQIFTGLRETPPKGASLYRRILGLAFDDLPPALRAAHGLRGSAAFEGRAVIERPAGLLANLFADIMGFPKAGHDVPVRVDFEIDGEREIWRRNFAGRQFKSIQAEGKGRFEGLEREAFGPVNAVIGLEVKDGRLTLVMRGWTLFGVPMPAWLGPTTIAQEFEDEQGRFNFDAEIGMALFGRVVRYRGWLVPAGPSPG